MKADLLFLERDCQQCGIVKAVLNLKAATSDEFRGNEGQEFHVFASQSNAASLVLLKAFNLVNCSMPVLVTHDDAILTKTREIVDHLVLQGMASR